VQFVEPPAGADGRHRVEHSLEFGTVAPVGRGHGQAERRAMPLNHEVPLRALFTPTDRAQLRAASPFLACTEEESTEARDQSSALPP
jgi:hypothetical protein